MGQFLEGKKSFKEAVGSNGRLKCRVLPLASFWIKTGHSLDADCSFSYAFPTHRAEDKACTAFLTAAHLVIYLLASV